MQTLYVNNFEDSQDDHNVYGLTQAFRKCRFECIMKPEVRIIRRVIIIFLVSSNQIHDQFKHNQACKQDALATQGSHWVLGVLNCTWWWRLGLYLHNFRWRSWFWLLLYQYRRWFCYRCRWWLLLRLLWLWCHWLSLIFVVSLGNVTSSSRLCTLSILVRFFFLLILWLLFSRFVLSFGNNRLLW